MLSEALLLCCEIEGLENLEDNQKIYLLIKFCDSKAIISEFPLVEIIFESDLKPRAIYDATRQIGHGTFFSRPAIYFRIIIIIDCWDN